ncbi:ArsR family transcriptional regulator [Diaminobutyricimonas sp. TR449]|uniref:ArsR/SmtB family transcription factor n=1 Tax=Diaminobutyricimonas sp. TR449 TaxID=2708076 RepID=UPI001422994A|nr:ArsR family transcriptional regulator [Diaminobutyricimonas sp. TR449]
MDPFTVLGNPVRRRLVEILCSGSHTSGMLTAAVMTEFRISRSAVQRHLATLVRLDWVDIRPDRTERHYSLREEALDSLAAECGWLYYLWQRRIGWHERNEPQLWHTTPFDPDVYTQVWRNVQ